MSNGNGWRAEPHGNQYLISNGPRFVLAGGPHAVLALNGNRRDEPFRFHTGDDTWQWALARLNGENVNVSRVDGDGHVWIITAVTGGRHTVDDYLMCVGRIDETDGGWEALAANGTLLRHWHGWNADGAHSGYPDQADAVRAVVKFHDLAVRSRATALATGSASAVTEEGPWRVKWARTTGKSSLVVEGRAVVR